MSSKNRNLISKLSAQALWGYNCKKLNDIPYLVKTIFNRGNSEDLGNLFDAFTKRELEEIISNCILSDPEYHPFHVDSEYPGDVLSPRAIKNCEIFGIYSKKSVRDRKINDLLKETD